MLLQSEVKHFSNGSNICYMAYFRSVYIDEEVEFKNLCTSCMHMFPLYISQQLDAGSAQDLILRVDSAVRSVH